MADVKEAAIALGNVYRRAGDARLRLAARMQTARHLSSPQCRVFCSELLVNCLRSICPP